MSQLIPNTTPLRTFGSHERTITAVAVFPDMCRMVTGSWDKTLRLWDLETGVVLKMMEGHSSEVAALAVSRDGQIIASADGVGEIIAWHGENGESLTKPIKAHSKHIYSVDFSPDGTVLATGSWDGMTKFWCTKTWQMQGDPIECLAYCIQYSPSGELLAIATFHNIQIYNPGTRERVTSFKAHTDRNVSLAWTPDGTRLLSGGDRNDPTIREWDPLTWQQVGHLQCEGHTTDINAIAIDPTSTLVASSSHDKQVRLWRLSDRQNIGVFEHSSPQLTVTFSVDGRHILSGGEDIKISKWEVHYKRFYPKILAITTARDACRTGDLPTADELLTQNIHTNANDYTSYAHHSFVMARQHNWDHALQDAIKSISIQPSLTGYISKGIALCGKGLVWEARVAFDVASMFTNKDSKTNLLLLIKAIALFNAAQHEEAMFLVKELADACPDVDILGCHVVEAYLRVQLGIDAFDDARHDEAADHFTAAVHSGAFSSKYIHFIYEDLTVLFGWDLDSLLLTTHQKRCQALLSAGKSDEALEAHKYMMDTIDEPMKASCLEWSNEFKERCNALAVQNDRILAAEIPGQDHGGYDAEPSFFHGMHPHSQNSRRRPQRRHRRLKRLRLALTRSPHSAPSASPAPPTTSPPITTTPSFAHRWRDFLHFSTQPNTPQSIPLQPRRRNFNLLRGGSSIRTVEVAAGRKKNRIYVSPPSAAEVARAEAAAAAQHANGNQAGSSAQAGQPQPVSGTQVSQGRPTENVTQASSGGTGDTSYEVNCCGFFFGHRRPTSHQS